ncbi:hypothetical protein D3C78_1359730 [compost metagenome]
MNHQTICKDSYVGTFTNHVSFAKLNCVFTIWNISTECMVQVQMLHKEHRVIITDSRDQKTFCIIWVRRNYKFDTWSLRNQTFQRVSVKLRCFYTAAKWCTEYDWCIITSTGTVTQTGSLNQNLIQRFKNKTYELNFSNRTESLDT